MSIDLRSRYDLANERVLKKQLPRLEKHSRAFIARSPFLVLASTGRDGRLDASPRGDAPGFVQIIDDDTLAIPDRPGNNRLDTLDNVAANPHVGMIFFIPGMNETLRVNGQAQITFEPALLESLGFNGKPARSVLVVKTEEVFFHCGKALIRSDLWNPDKHIERRAFPTLGSIITDVLGGDSEAAAAADLRVEDDYRTRLY